MESAAPATRTPLVLVELADPGHDPGHGPGAGRPGTGDELATLLGQVLRSTGTAAALAHRLGAHAALLAD
jgi:hypothetical protein